MGPRRGASSRSRTLPSGATRRQETVLLLIGDIHGCYDELRELLERIGPSADDRLVSVGDLVDRGPMPVEVVDLFRTRPGAAAVLGNHEDKHLRSARGALAPALSQVICREQAGGAYASLLEWFATLPLYLDLPEALVVHAGYEPELPLGEQPRNVLLRCKWPGERGLGGDPMRWAERYRGERPVVYGHTVFREPRVLGRTFGLDTGACLGNQLTALVLPAERLVSVPAREDYWRRVRSEHRTALSARAKGPPPDTPLVDAALALLETLFATLPRPEGRVGRRALAAVLDAHPAGDELRPLAFAPDRRRELLLRRFATAHALGAAVERWRGLAAEHPPPAKGRC